MFQSLIYSNELNIKLKGREWIKNNNKTTTIKFKVMLPVRDTPQI